MAAPKLVETCTDADILTEIQNSDYIRCLYESRDFGSPRQFLKWWRNLSELEQERHKLGAL